MNFLRNGHDRETNHEQHVELVTPAQRSSPHLVHTGDYEAFFFPDNNIEIKRDPDANKNRCCVNPGIQY